jgi:hypothetical protein
LVSYKDIEQDLNVMKMEMLSGLMKNVKRVSLC